MGWSTPYSATTGDLITASIWNTYIKNQQRYLKGLDGAVEIEDDLTVPNLITPGNVDGVDVGDHAANTTTAHGAVSAATASKHVVRDGSARAKFAAPAGAGDALIKGTRVTLDELPATTDEFYLVGTGANMEERAVPAAGATVTIATTNVYNAAAPNQTWTDLDINAVVGSNVAIVICRFLNNDSGTPILRGRTNGEGTDVREGISGSGSHSVNPGVYCYFCLTTDSSGIFEWWLSAADDVQIDVIAFAVS